MPTTAPPPNVRPRPVTPAYYTGPKSLLRYGRPVEIIERYPEMDAIRIRWGKIEATIRSSEVSLTEVLDKKEQEYRSSLDPYIEWMGQGLDAAAISELTGQNQGAIKMIMAAIRRRGLDPKAQ